MFDRFLKINHISKIEKLSIFHMNWNFFINRYEFILHFYFIKGMPEVNNYIYLFTFNLKTILWYSQIFGL